MFEGSLVESKHLLRTNNRWTTLVSLSVQLALAAIVVALPLLHPEALPFSAPRISLVAPHPQTPPQPQTMRASAAAADPRVYSPPRPGPIIMHPMEPVSPLPPDGTLIAGAYSGNSIANPFIAIGNSTPHIVSSPTPPPAENKPRTVKISSGVAQGLLLTPLHPVYPPIAVATRTQGVVIIRAVISKAGAVESMEVLSGPPMLRNAALDAVREARYSPYKLNGEPVIVDTTFTINFTLAD